MNAASLARIATSAEKAPWWAAGLLAVGAGAAVATAPLVLFVGAALAVVLALFAVVFAEPRWGVIANVALLTGYVIDVLRSHGSPVTVDTLPVLVLVALGIRVAVGGEIPSIPYRHAAALGAVVATTALSIFAASEVQASTQRLADLVRNVLLVLIVLALVDTPLWLRRLTWAVAVPAGVLALLAVAQQVTGSSFAGFASLEDDNGLARSAGPLSANYFAEVTLYAAVLFLYLGLASGPRLRWAAFSAALVCAVAVGLSFSRGALLVGLAILIVILALRHVRLGLLPLAGAAVVVLALAILPGAARDRLHELTTPVTEGAAASSDASLRGRA
jgi:hypothetical protein